MTSWMRAGIPAVEFGPVGGGHHGPAEWVSLASLPRYRQALVDFIRLLPEQPATTETEKGMPGMHPSSEAATVQDAS